jgi:undecaprenyl-diphosphatase
MGYVKKHDFKVFAWYRIVLGVLVLALVIMGFMGAGTAPVM